MIWFSWKHRNALVFENAFDNIESLIQKVKGSAIQSS